MPVGIFQIGCVQFEIPLKNLNWANKEPTREMLLLDINGTAKYGRRGVY